MKTMKLISMTEFVLEYSKENYSKTYFPWWCVNYANFLNQPLTLGMFVPCDEEGNVWREPDSSEWDMNNFTVKSAYNRQVKQYQQAKEHVLFKGFELFNGGLYKEDCKRCFYSVSQRRWDTGLTFVESLEDYEPELTPTALKQIGL